MSSYLFFFSSTLVFTALSYYSKKKKNIEEKNSRQGSSWAEWKENRKLDEFSQILQDKLNKYIPLSNESHMDIKVLHFSAERGNLELVAPLKPNNTNIHGKFFLPLHNE